MSPRYIIASMFSLAAGCLDTHDASLGEQQRTDPPGTALDGGGPEGADAAPPEEAPDAEPDAAFDGGEGAHEEGGDASSSSLCRREPWHCT